MKTFLLLPVIVAAFLLLLVSLLFGEVSMLAVRACTALFRRLIGSGPRRSANP